MKVQTKIIVFTSIVMVLVIIMTLLVVKHYLESTLDKQFERRLTTVSQLALIASSHIDARLRSDYPQSLDELADNISSANGMRVSYISEYGVVYADSAFNPSGTASLDNHSDRPEIIAAKKNQLGVSRRYSDSIQEAMVYVASYSPEQQLFA